jgi:hypothetical protein
MAFDQNNDTQPIGSFKLPSDGQLIDCIGGVRVSCFSFTLINGAVYTYETIIICEINIKNAATHKLNNAKQLATVDWVPPKNYMGTVVFR